MQYNPNTRGMGEFLRGPDARRVTTLAAGRVLARARSLVGKDSGETAASGHLIHQNRGGVKRDRVVVTVAFGGAAVQQQWGRGANRFLTRALESGGD